VHDYEHAEVEPDGAIGTLFEIEGQELRAVLDGTLPGGFAATAGVQWQEVDLAAAGEEAFLPPSVTRATGLFAFGRRALGAGSLELGLRLDRQEVDAEGFEEYQDESINASAGLTWPIGGEFELVAQLVRSERHPTASELFANGPHAATQQFEIGDPAIETERGWTADLGLRRASGRTHAEVRAFASQYDGYVFLSPTGAIMDDLPVFAFLQDDARFYGIEAQVDMPLDSGGTTILSLSGDYVEGRLDGGGDLPRIPPLRLGAELSWTGDALAASLAVRHHFSQDQIAVFETETGSYTMLDASLSWRPGWGGLDALLFLKASNLLDEVARVHSSPLKDTVPLPGRSFAAGLRFSFGGEGG
jgi:iron complex outermembrane receptor protein